MDSQKLKQIQVPIKEEYKTKPQSAKITLKSQGRLGENVTCSIQTAKALVTAGLHPKTGGDGMSLCSGDMLLEALVACAGVTLNAVATAIGIQVDEGFVKVEGDLDFRGTLGVDKTTPVGFSEIRMKFDIKSNATEEQLATLYKLTERYCVVYQTLMNPPKIIVNQ